nr:MAG TPA_asm: hypothetical protein [Caudoviricetes sp.]
MSHLSYKFHLIPSRPIQISMELYILLYLML